MRRFLLTSTALTLIAVTSPAYSETITPPLTISDDSYNGKTLEYTTTKSESDSAISVGGSTDIQFTPIIKNYTRTNGNGGAITTNSLNNNLTLINASLEKNQAQNGGGIYFYGQQNLNISGGSFIGNIGIDNGGALQYRADNGSASRLNITDNASFSQNTAKNGGAISIVNTATTKEHNINASFMENHATNGSGGALYFNASAQEKTINISDSSFTNNTATVSGGAIYSKGTLIFTGQNNFSGNKVNQSANDIHLDGGLMKIASSASVTLGNRNNGVATDKGGISGTGTINIDGTFDIGLSDINASNIVFNNGSNLYITVSYLGSDNNFDYGTLNGNVTVGGSLKFFMDDTTYKAIKDDGRQASIEMKDFGTATSNQNGLNYIYSAGKYIISKAVSYLGPNLYLFASGATIPSDFYPNAESENWGKNGSYTITNNPSDTNESKIEYITNAGAGGADGLTSGSAAAVINNGTGKTYAFDIRNYTGNGNGGALINNGSLTVNSGSVFDHNQAQNGGAIYNDNGKELTIKGIATITNNIATSEGGAVYNAGTLTLDTTNGDITFSGNKANTNVANDIYNSGTLKISGGKTVSLGGGINNASQNKDGSIEVDGTTLKLGSNADIYTNTLSFSNATLNAADGADLFANGDIGFTNTAVTLANSEINGSNLTFTGGSLALGTSSLTATNNLSFSNIGKIDASQATLNGKNISFDNAGIDIGSNELKADGDITFKNNSNLFLTVQNETQYGKLTATNITNNGGKMTVTVASNAFGSSDEITVDILNASRKLEEGDFNAPIAADNNFFEIKYNDTDDGSYTITKKGDPTPTPTPGGETMGIAEAWQKAGFTSAGAEEVYQHLQHVSSLKDAYTALAPTEAPVIQTALIQIQNQIIGAVSSQLTGGLSSPVSEGKSAGDGILNKVRSWVKLLVNHAKYSAHNGFSSDVQGVSMGVDKLIHEDFRLGLGYAYTNGDIDGFWRSSDLTSHTAILYGEYKPSNWYVNGIATYGWADYEEKKNLQGLLVRSKYDVDSFGLQVMTGYDFGIYTPEIGLRYARFKRDGYRDTADQYVSSDTSDILTAIMGVKFEKQFTTCGGTRWKPEARLAATYDLITDEDNALVTLNNGAAYEAKGEHLKRFGVEFGAGVNIEVNDKVDVSFGYEGHFRKDYQDHTGMVSAIYKF